MIAPADQEDGLVEPRGAEELPGLDILRVAAESSLEESDRPPIPLGAGGGIGGIARDAAPDILDGRQGGGVGDDLRVVADQPFQQAGGLGQERDGPVEAMPLEVE